MIGVAVIIGGRGQILDAMQFLGAAVDEIELADLVGGNDAFAHLLENGAIMGLALGDLAFGHDRGGFFGAGAKHARNLAALVANRRIGKIVPGIFGISVAHHLQIEILEVGRLTRQRPIDQRRNVAPDIGPGLSKRDAKCVRVLGPENRRVAIVVEEGEVRPPRAEHRIARIEQQTDYRAQ